MRLSRALVAVLVGALSSAQGLAYADEAADTATARTLGIEGVRMAIAGKCADAVDKLERSEALHHSPIVLERLGECQVAVGRVVDGSESLRRMLREPVPPAASSAILAARDQATRTLGAATQRIAHLTVVVTGAQGAEVWAKIDGVSIPAASLNSSRAIDPGDHVVEAGASGFVSATAKVHSNEAASDSVTLSLREDPHASPAPVVAAVPQSPLVAVAPSAPIPPPVAAESPRSHTVAYAAFGVGAAGIVLGAITGVIALSDKGSLSTACHNDVCPTSSQSTLNGGETAGTISTVAFIVGGVGLAAGVTLYFVDLGGHHDESHGAVGAYVGPGSAGLTGSF